MNIATYVFMLMIPCCMSWTVPPTRVSPGHSLLCITFKSCSELQENCFYALILSIEI